MSHIVPTIYSRSCSAAPGHTLGAGHLTAFQNNSIINERGTDERVIQALLRFQQQNPMHRGSPDTQTQAEVQDTARRRAATRTTKDSPSWMRSIPYTRQHLPSERLAHIL